MTGRALKNRIIIYPGCDVKTQEARVPFARRGDFPFWSRALPWGILHHVWQEFFSLYMAGLISTFTRS
jgi:hypothetical protein